jgi:hypothetical protein
MVIFRNITTLLPESERAKFAGETYVQEDYEYVSTFINGKKLKNNVLDYRILTKGITTGLESMFWLSEDQFGSFRSTCNLYSLADVSLYLMKVISPTHIKNRNYNYYYLNSDEVALKDILVQIKEKISYGSFMKDRVCI